MIQCVNVFTTKPENVNFVLFSLVALSFEIGSLYIALTMLELIKSTRLFIHSQRSPCLCLLNTMIKGVYHHTLL